MINFDFLAVADAVKTAYSNGTGTFEECCTAANLPYYKAGTNPLKKRGTPTTIVDNEIYDFHRLLKACNIDIVKHERLTAGGERIPAQRLKIDKVKSACNMFVTRLYDITGIQFTNDIIDNLDYNKLVELSIKEAIKQDKQAEKERAEAIERAKVEKQRKAAAAKVEKASDEDKLYLAAAALGVSIEELKAIKKNLKPAKVTK